MPKDDPEVEQVRALLGEFELSAVWQHIYAEVSRAREEDVKLLLGGTDRDDRIRGGIAMADDVLKIPERLRTRIEELEKED